MILGDRQIDYMYFSHKHNDDISYNNIFSYFQKRTRKNKEVQVTFVGAETFVKATLHLSTKVMYVSIGAVICS